MDRIQKAIQIMDEAVKCMYAQDHEGIWDNLIKMKILACSSKQEWSAEEP